MCGIAGYFYFYDKKDNSDVIKDMSKVIAHRGSDDEGFVFIDTMSVNKKFLNLSSNISDPEIKLKYPVIKNENLNFEHNLAMSHRRYSIIDLSISGHQPMWNTSNTICVSFNGEIFNYIELRNELSKQGYKFKTNSDTEIIIAGYSVWGKDVFNHFTGFWAISLYDRKNNILILSRDRVGKKPLYIYQNERMIVWASEIKAILQIVEPTSLELDPSSIWNYLYYGQRDIAHFTFWDKIKMMDNSSYTIISHNEHSKSEVFWEIPFIRRKENEISISNSVDKFTDLLKLSLNERLRADVPIAFELSGGLDSSALVALRAKMSKNKFSAFTVKYSNKKVDESHYAEMLAKKYNNIDHRIIGFKDINLWNYMNDFVYLEEEPFHNPNLIVNQLLRKNIKDRGYKVIIAGSGGDELLGGYTEYAVPIMKNLFSNRQYFKFLKNLFLYKEKYPLRFIPIMRIILNKINRFVPKNTVNNIYIRMEPKNSNIVTYPKNINELFISNMKDLKMFYWMSSGDKATMGIPIETRAPFLDHRIIDFIFSLPISYFMNNGWLKWLLRQSMQDLLPKEILWRKEKMGFPFPLQNWLMKSETIIKYVLNEYSNPWINTKLITRDFLKLIETQPSFLWRLISFQLWYIAFIHNDNINYGKFK